MKNSIISIFKRGLAKSAVKISRSLGALFGGEAIQGKESFAELEMQLAEADFGLAAAGRITAAVRERYELGQIATGADLKRAAGETVLEILRSNCRGINFQPSGLTVILLAGVNGSGKTTTIGKMAAKFCAEGKKTVLGACDTFRAAAAEQLQLWGDRTGAAVVSSRHGADPAGVAFESVKKALEINADVVLIDTAGRQQNQKNLMDELAKIRRAVGKALPGAPHETLLTVDASLGSNVISQAREFSRAAGVTALVLTKLDGTGRGGMAVALKCEFDLPTVLVGLGEAPDDLQEFDPEYFVSALFGEE